jgi:hypothetical protein
LAQARIRALVIRKFSLEDCRHGRESGKRSRTALRVAVLAQHGVLALDTGVEGSGLQLAAQRENLAANDTIGRALAVGDDANRTIGNRDASLSGIASLDEFRRSTLSAFVDRVGDDVAHAREDV